MVKEKRIGFDRRSLTDGRRLFKYGSPLYAGPEKRTIIDRRSKFENRSGWVRISHWSSKSLQDLEERWKDKTQGE